jgi:hypothetical protein
MQIKVKKDKNQNSKVRIKHKAYPTKVDINNDMYFILDVC